MKAHLYAKTADGRDVPIVVDEFGNFSAGAGGGTGSTSAASDAKGWSYAAASGGVTDTNNVTLAAAPGAGKCNYLSALQVINKDASVGTEVVIKSGSTILHRLWSGEGGNGYVVTFPRPLVAAENTALTAACITDSSETYINAQGFIAGLPNEVALRSNAYEEVVNYIGTLVVTDAGEQIALAA